MVMFSSYVKLPDGRFGFSVPVWQWLRNAFIFGVIDIKLTVETS